MLLLLLSVPALLISLGLFFLVRPLISMLLALGANVLYGLLGRGIEIALRGSDILFRATAPPFFEATLDPEPIMANTVILWTLILATPGVAWLRRLKAGGIAAGLLLASQVLFLITMVEFSLVSAEHPLAGSPLIWRFWDDFFEVSGKGFLPIAIWLALFLTPLLGRKGQSLSGASGKPPRDKAGRNSPCPCGSGRKYKVCCGA